MMMPAEAIKKKIKNIDYVSPTVNSSYQIVNGNQNWNTSVYGVTPEYLHIRSQRPERFVHHDSDLKSRNRVTVIGTTVASTLFDTSNPVGKNDPHQQPALPGLSASGKQRPVIHGAGPKDDMVIVPLTTAREILMGITYVLSINIRSEAPINRIGPERSETSARQRHHITGDKEDDLREPQSDQPHGNHDQHDDHADTVSGSIAAFPSSSAVSAS